MSSARRSSDSWTPTSFVARAVALVMGCGMVVACGGGSAKLASPSVEPSAAPTVGREGGAVPPKASRMTVPGPAAKRPVVHEYFGTRVTDDYEWLEDGKSDEVQAFVAAENTAARSFLDGVDARPALRSRLAELLGASTTDYLAIRRLGPSTKGPSTLMILAQQPPKQQPLLVTRSETGEPSSEHVVLDPNVLDPSGKTTIDFFVPSPDGKLVAVSLSKDGSESGDVHLFDVATGKERSDVIARVHGGTAGGSLAWNADGTGFYYTRYPRAGERADADLDFFQQVWFHKLGTAESADVFSIGKDFPRIAEVELERSDDGRFVMARVANGDGGEYEHHVLRFGTTTWKRLSTFDDELTTLTFAPNGKLYGLSLKGAPKGKVVVFEPPFDKPAQTIVAEGSGVIEDVAVTSSGMYLVELVGGPSRMRRIPLDTKSEPLAREVPKPGAKPKKKGPSPSVATKAASGPVTIAPGVRGIAAAELPLPPVSSVTAVVRLGDDLLVRNESYTDPPAWYRYRANEHRLTKTALAKAPPADMSDVEVVRETCSSKDGTKVPMSVLRKKGRPLDGTIPTLLTGYGGFSVSRKPRLRPWYRAWLDGGGALAEANLRGGGEMGEDWHRAGRLTQKQNVFDDFYACARGLVDLGYTTPARLAAFGRSNGGLLMGAEIVQHPEAFRAVVAGVGIYDMLRTELSPNGAFNITEFGTVKDEAQFRALRAYSPFHNVKDGVAYPAVLFMTGANDPRVDPYHSRKMLARLRAANTSEQPIVLRASQGTGHGMGTPLSEEIDETADMLAFLFEELGMKLSLR